MATALIMGNDYTFEDLIAMLNATLKMRGSVTKFYNKLTSKTWLGLFSDLAKKDDLRNPLRDWVNIINCTRRKVLLECVPDNQRTHRVCVAAVSVNKRNG